jgi:hypothetical protein
VSRFERAAFLREVSQRHARLPVKVRLLLPGLKHCERREDRNVANIGPLSTTAIRKRQAPLAPANTMRIIPRGTAILPLS